MKECNYKPSGELQGDTKAMPDRGTRTGMNGDTYGASLDQGATNSHGKLGGATKSDAWDQGRSMNPINK
jgi:hypothetical protein